MSLHFPNSIIKSVSKENISANEPTSPLPKPFHQQQRSSVYRPALANMLDSNRRRIGGSVLAFVDSRQALAFYKDDPEDALSGDSKNWGTMKNHETYANLYEEKLDELAMRSLEYADDDTIYAQKNREISKLCHEAKEKGFLTEWILAKIWIPSLIDSKPNQSGTKKDYQEVIALCRKFIREGKATEATYLALASIYNSMGRFGAETRIYRQAQRRGFAQDDVYHKWIKNYDERSGHKNPRSFSKKIWSNHSRVIKKQERVLISAIERGKAGNSLFEYMQIKASWMEEGRDLKPLGFVNPEKVLKAAQEAFYYGSANDWTYLFKAEALWQMGRKEDCVKVLAEMLKSDAMSRIEFYNYWVEKAEKLDDVQGAIALCQQVRENFSFGARKCEVWDMSHESDARAAPPEPKSTSKK